MFDPLVIGATVDFVTDFAGGGPTLEPESAPVSTALPLAARGMAVRGIDLSPTSSHSSRPNRVRRTSV